MQQMEIDTLSVIDNDRLHLGSHFLHIPATLLATMWTEFHSDCEGQV